MALEWPQHFSHYKSMGIFPDAQGQLTPQSEVEPGQNSNSSGILWLSLLFPGMKWIQSKMRLLEWPQHFPHYNSMGTICCHGNQSSDPICLKTYGRQSLTPMLLQQNLTAIGQLVSEIFKIESVDARTDGRTEDGSTTIL